MFLDALHLLAPLADAIPGLQAGGGGGFGSGRGGGGGGGGGDAGWVIYLLLRLVFEVPIVGVPALIVVIVVAWRGSRRGWNVHQERVIRRVQPALTARRADDALERLRAADPAFDVERFLGRTADAFRTAQHAWCAQDLAPLRPFVSDGVFERFSLQIAEQRRDGWRQELEDLAVDRPSVQHLEVGRHFDALTVRIPFAARIHRVALDSGERIGGATLPETSFVECWTFLRRRGARTVNARGLIEGQCPSCGAPIAVGQNARCGHCECLVRSGEHDWVLVEITQASVWAAEPESGVPGLAAYVERDPGLSLAALEDRASVAFWRWCAALRRGAKGESGPSAPLRKLATAEFCDGLDAALALPSAKELTADAAVGSVRTLGVLAGAERDRVVVEVHWDGRRATLRKDGSLDLEVPRRMRRTLFVFTRASGARSRVEHAFTATCCGTCGAADDGSLAPLCAYCGAPRVGDRSAWLLDGVRAAGEARELISELRALRGAAKPSLAAPPPVELLLAWTAAVLRADGEVTEQERRGFTRLASDFGVPSRRIDAMLAVDGADARVERDLAAADAEQARAWLGALVEAALGDGALHARERKLLVAAARALGLDPRALEQAIAAKRSAMYREARAAQRTG